MSSMISFDSLKEIVIWIVGGYTGARTGEKMWHSRKNAPQFKPKEVPVEKVVYRDRPVEKQEEKNTKNTSIVEDNDFS